MFRGCRERDVTVCIVDEQIFELELTISHSAQHRRQRQPRRRIWGPKTEFLRCRRRYCLQRGWQSFACGRPRSPCIGALAGAGAVTTAAAGAYHERGNRDGHAWRGRSRASHWCAAPGTDDYDATPSCYVGAGSIDRPKTSCGLSGHTARPKTEPCGARTTAPVASCRGGERSGQPTETGAGLDHGTGGWFSR